MPWLYVNSSPYHNDELPSYKSARRLIIAWLRVDQIYLSSSAKGWSSAVKVEEGGSSGWWATSGLALKADFAWEACAATRPSFRVFFELEQPWVYGSFFVLSNWAIDPRLSFLKARESRPHVSGSLRWWIASWNEYKWPSTALLLILTKPSLWVAFARKVRQTDEPEMQIHLKCLRIEHNLTPCPFVYLAENRGAKEIS